MPNPQKVSTCLWFDTQALEAAEYYVSLFENSRVTGISRYPKDAPLPEGAPRMPEGTPLMVTFELAGTEYMALNGGPLFPFTEAASIVVKCKDQAEIDRLWSRLTEGGSESQCGWLKDRYGLSWQIVPENLATLLDPANADAAARVFAAIMGMVKLDIARLERAYQGEKETTA